MLVIGTDNSIEITRGDTAYIQVPIFNDSTGEEYVVQTTDVLTMSVKRNVKDSEYCFQKTVQGSNTFHIEHADTCDCAFGTYKYDVQLTTLAGDIYTVVAPSIFKICAEVTTD